MPGQDPLPGILMVASYDDRETGTRNGATSSFSSRGLQSNSATYPDISAPGSNILSACRPALLICSAELADTNYGTISGTSMATPHMAGIVAQVMQAAPALTPGQIENLLEDTAYKFSGGGGYVSDPRNTDNTTSYDKGHGLVDAAAAVASALGVAPPPAP
jgi:serine protease AprX